MQSADTALAGLLKRDRLVVGAALALVMVLAWAYVLWLSTRMAMPAAPAATTEAMSGAPASGDMSNMDMNEMAGAVAPVLKAWGATDFAFMFLMWSVMMVGMMTPSVAPMVLLYAGVGRKAIESGAAFASTGWFFAGYLAGWIGFSALATFAQWILIRLALLTPMLASSSTVFGGIVLIAVGLYQWTPLKESCLRSCQAPLNFLMAHGGFRSKPLGAFSLGLTHSAYCLGCCVALMALLFVGGVMNLLWIAGLTILIFLEKIVPSGQLISRFSGILIGAAGVWLLIRGV